MQTAIIQARGARSQLLELFVESGELLPQVGEFLAERCDFGFKMRNTRGISRAGIAMLRGRGLAIVRLRVR